MFPGARLETLANGMRLVLVGDDHVESVCTGIFVSSGSRHEPSRLAGISHFIEHMLFKGTENRSALEISQAIEGRGGNFNAYTSEEGTCFFARLPSDRVDVAIDVLSDMYLHAAIPDDEFARERQVILEEIKMYDDEPDAVASENLSRALFPDNALGAPIAGGAATLLKMQPRTLRDYVRRCYVPAATIVVVSGHFDEDRVRALVAERLGGGRGGKAPSYVKVSPRSRPRAEIRAARDIQQVQLALGYRMFGAKSPRRLKSAASVFDALMGRSMSSRLFQSVREKRGLSYDIRSQLQFFDDVGGWAITAGLDTSRVDEAMAAIDRELKLITSRKPSVAEVERTKEYLLGNMRLGLESVQSRMFFCGNCVQTYGRIVDPAEVFAGIAAVTPADVLDVANRILRPNVRAASWVTPK